MWHDTQILQLNPLPLYLEEVSAQTRIIQVMTLKQIIQKNIMVCSLEWVVFGILLVIASLKADFQVEFESYFVEPI